MCSAQGDFGLKARKGSVMDLLSLVDSFLSFRFIKSEKMAKAILLGLVARKNVIFFGPGGHAKSELARSLIRDLLGLDAPVKSFGGGTTEESLYGGMDIAELRKSGRQKFLFEGSWMDKGVSIWEELFDAPARVLTSLKNTLTAGRYEADRQEDCYDMHTKCIVALTNLEPSQVAEAGPDVEALVQRFPIQLRVAWDSYESSDFLSLFRTVRGNGKDVVVDMKQVRQLLIEAQERASRVKVEGMMPVLAELIAKARTQADISPRTAVHALGLVAASAAIAGREVATKEDLLVLEFLPGMESLADNIRTELDAALARADAERLLAEAEADLRRLVNEADGADTPIKALQAKKRLVAFGDRVSGLKVTDALVDRRKKLRDAVDAKATAAGARAEDLVRI